MTSLWYLLSKQDARGKNPAVEKRVLNLSSPHKRPTEIVEEELVRQVDDTDWTIAVNSVDYQCFAEKLQCAKMPGVALGKRIRKSPK